MENEYYELALFAGAGGGILGGKLCGHTCIGAVEIEEYPRKVLLQRQRDGILPGFPIWDDVRTFSINNPECREFFEWARKVKNDLVITGGFPCQDISTGGAGSGIDGTRSGLWKEFARITDEIRPAVAWVENSPALTSRGLGTVLGDLAEMGYNARWAVLGAGHVGASHARERIWILARNNELLNEQGNIKEKVQGIKRISRLNASRIFQNFARMSSEFEPKLCRHSNGLPNQVDRLKANGNAQFPAVVKAAWELLK